MNKEQMKEKMSFLASEGYKTKSLPDARNFIRDSDKLTIGNKYECTPIGYDVLKWQNDEGKFIAPKTILTLSDDAGEKIEKSVIGEYESAVVGTVIMAEKAGKPVINPKTGAQYRNFSVLSTVNVASVKES